MKFRNTCVKVGKSRSMHVWWMLCDKFEAWGVLWLPSLWVEVGIVRWLTPTNPSLRSMHSSTLLRGLINFCNKYMSSLWLIWVHGLYALLPFHNLLASTVLCIALSHLESWCNFAGASKPRDTIRSIIHKPPYIFLKTATITTYHGISIANLRYITMQLASSSSWHTLLLSYCHCMIM